MRASSIVVMGLLMASGLVSPLQAQEHVSLETVLARARERAPAVLVARSRIEEARSAQVAASARFQENPELSAAIGPRWAGSETLTDVSVGVSQFFETGGRRQSRIAMANADIEAATAEADGVLRETLRNAANRYYRLVSTLDLLDILSRAHETAIEIERIAGRRFALGDVAILDVNVAKATRARAEAEIGVARADMARQSGELSGLLDWPGLDPQLFDRTTWTPREVDAANLAPGIATRPDIVALEAMQRLAEAEQRLASGSRRPEFGVSLDVDREEGSPAVIGGFVVRLPLFQHGQGQAAAAVARLARLRLERDSARIVAETGLRAAIIAYRHQVAAARVLEADAVLAGEENEQLARRSYEAGQISLADWLLYRRELLETQREYIDKRLLSALTLVEIDTMAGVLR